MTLPGLARNMTPSCTSGVISCEPGTIAQDQTSRSPATFSRVTWSSGLWPQPSGDCRQCSQSAAGGSSSIASVTGLGRSTWAPATEADSSRQRQAIMVMRSVMAVPSGLTLPLRGPTQMRDDLSPDER